MYFGRNEIRSSLYRCVIINYIYLWILMNYKRINCIHSEQFIYLSHLIDIWFRTWQRLLTNWTKKKVTDKTCLNYLLSANCHCYYTCIFFNWILLHHVWSIQKMKHHHHRNTFFPHFQWKFFFCSDVVDAIILLVMRWNVWLMPSINFYEHYYPNNYNRRSTQI